MGNTGVSTATLIIDDGLSMAGNFYLSAFTGYGGGLSTVDAVQTNFAYTGFNSPEVTAYGTGESTVSADASYTGSMLNRLNLLQATERGQMWQNNALGIAFVARSEIASSISTYTLQRNTPSTTATVYSGFRRIQNGQNFANYVTVTGVGLAPRTGVNTSSVATYGRAGYNISTVDANVTQALGLANWIASSQGVPSDLRFEVDITSAANTGYNGLFNLLYDVLVLRATTVSLTYRIPGAGSDTTTQVVVEGMRISGTPDQSDFTLYLSPATYYQYFTLDSSTYGILDTSRLGW